MTHPTPQGPPIEEYRFAGPPLLRVLRQPVVVAGRTEQWHVVEAQAGIPGVVCVGARAGLLALGRHWRLASSQPEWEFPRGFGEAGEHPEASAAREFVEETGLPVDACRDLGWFYPDSGLLAGRVHAVEVRVGAGTAGPVDGELGQLDWFTPDQLWALVATGQLRDGMTLSALALWQASARR